MRRLSIGVAVIAAVTFSVLIVFGLGLDDGAARMVVALQRDFQNALGRSLRALRAGEAGAVVSFLGVCFAYGFLHALGPGHGKGVIAAYGIASDSALRKMVSIAGLSSIGQAAVAVAMVSVGVWFWHGARENVEGLAGKVEPFSMLAIAALGLFLALRGIRHMSARADHAHHHHDENCGCGHAPSMEKVSVIQNWREAGAVVLGIALRPCTGALFLLLLTWRFEIYPLGILGAFVMGLGTFMITGLAAAATVAVRRGITLSLPAFAVTRRGGAIIEIIVGSLILVVGVSSAIKMF